MNIKNYILGLTGGIGSGKTAVSDRFEKLGIPIVDADVVSREVVEPGTEALTKIAEKFGDDILLTDGNLDRTKLREKIFTDSSAKDWLEELLHPLIGMEIYRQLDETEGDYIIFVSPLMVEASQQVLCDELLVVDVPEEVQIERTMARDNDDKAQVEAIIASQASRQDRLDEAHSVIENWHGFEELDKRVAELHASYLEKAKAKRASADS